MCFVFYILVTSTNCLPFPGEASIPLAKRAPRRPVPPVAMNDDAILVVSSVVSLLFVKVLALGIDPRCLQVLLSIVWNNLSHPQTQDNANVDNGGVKRKAMRITPDMSPATKQKIEDERREIRRVNSREWHKKFVSKGVSWCII